MRADSPHGVWELTEFPAPTQEKSAAPSVAQLRRKSIERLESLFGKGIVRAKGTKTRFRLPGGETLLLAVSHEYHGAPDGLTWWYTLRPWQIEILKRGEGFLALVCGQPDEIVMIPTREAWGLMAAILSPHTRRGPRVDIRLRREEDDITLLGRDGTARSLARWRLTGQQ